MEKRRKQNNTTEPLSQLRVLRELRTKREKVDRRSVGGRGEVHGHEQNKTDAAKKTEVAFQMYETGSGPPSIGVLGGNVGRGTGCIS